MTPWPRFSLPEIPEPDRSALRNRLHATVLLAIAMAAVDLFVSPVHLGVAAWALALGLGFLGPVPGGGCFERRWLRLAAHAGTALVLGTLLVVTLGLPASTLWFAPIWLGLTAVVDDRSRRWARNFPGVILEGALAGALLHLAGSFWFGEEVPVRFLIAAPALWILLRSVIGPRGLPAGAGEQCRLAAILIAALWLLRGLAGRTLHGSGDALWYSMVLGDAVEQLRHGVFPIWLGQSTFQFNGAFYPTRIAPAFHTAGAVLDLLTARTLGLFALQNLLLTLAGLGAAFTAYLGLASIAPTRRWTAAVFAVLFLACPGVLGIAYNTDLYMSWMTLPFAPVVFWGIVASFDQVRRRVALLALGGALGLSWWGHSPIALWLTAIAGFSQVVRLAGQRPFGAALRDSLPGALAFAGIAAYPIGSVLFYPPEAGGTATDFQVAVPGNILNFLREVQPRVYLPVSAIGRDLADFQLGYALWTGVLLMPFALRPLGRAGWTLWSVAAVFLVLLNPLPGLDFTWKLVPAFFRNTTGNWAMNRLYLVLALTIVFALAAALAARADAGRPRRPLFCALLFVAAAWSLAEAWKFGHGSGTLRRPAESAENLVLPENVKITRFAYLVLRWPHVFTHGVATPELQNRLRTESGELLADDLDVAAESGRLETAGELTIPPQAGDGPVDAAQQLVLRPGRQYVLEFDFLRPAGESAGTLALYGRTFSREYGLPEYGGDNSFGVGGSHSRRIGLSTTSGGLERVTVKFFPAAASRQPGVFARFRLLRYDPAVLPVEVQSWIPYVARVRSPAGAWLETPRMYQQDYFADASGVTARTRRSPDGLLQVAVPAGESLVRLRYVAPLGLQALFGLSVLAGLAVVALLARGFRAAARGGGAGGS